MPDIVFDRPQSPTDLLPRLLALPRGASVLLLGGVDSGKTTWARDAVRALSGAGRTVAVVDCDLGQSEIGPPATVGAALAAPGTDPRSLRDLAFLAAYFVGAVSPARHLLDVGVGAVRMARVAKKRRPDLVLIDTDGLIGGAAARAFKRRLAELLLPQVVVALARGPELDPLLSAFSHLDAPEVWRVPVSADAGRKTPAARATRRAARFLAALADAQSLTFSLDDIALQGTWLGAGEPLPHHLNQFLARSLGRPALHAEQIPGGGLYVVLNGDGWDAAGLAAVESHFGTRSVTITAAQKFAGLLVGLISPSGAMLGLGLIERIDFPRRTLTVLTPCRKPAAVAQAWLGGLRLRPDGREIGEVRPGEV
jgi:polynucleotide 5'-hydroxyl-kinase GRC3/NOL9